MGSTAFGNVCLFTITHFLLCHTRSSGVGDPLFTSAPLAFSISYGCQILKDLFTFTLSFFPFIPLVYTLFSSPIFLPLTCAHALVFTLSLLSFIFLSFFLSSFCFPSLFVSFSLPYLLLFLLSPSLPFLFTAPFLLSLLFFRMTFPIYFSSPFSCYFLQLPLFLSTPPPLSILYSSLSFIFFSSLFLFLILCSSHHHCIVHFLLLCLIPGLSLSIYSVSSLVGLTVISF